MNPISKLGACILCDEVKRVKFVSIISTVQAYCHFLSRVSNLVGCPGISNFRSPLTCLWLL